MGLCSITRSGQKRSAPLPMIGGFLYIEVHVPQSEIGLCSPAKDVRLFVTTKESLLVMNSWNPASPPKTSRESLKLQQRQLFQEVRVP